MEYLMIAPIAYLVLIALIKLRNENVDNAYSRAKHEASVMLAEGYREEAMELMDKAAVDHRRFYVRRFMGIKF